MAFATADDLFDFLGSIDSPTSGQTDRATLLVDLAQAAIEEEAGQALEEAETTETLDGNGREELNLSRWPVSDVASVAEDGEALTFDDDYRWSASGVLYRVDGWWEDKPRIVVVTYTAGWDPIPTKMKQLCLQVAARAWANPEGASSKTIDGVGSSRFATRGLELSEEERRIVGRWKA